MIFTPEHEQFRKSVRDFVEKDLNPHADEWEEAGIWPGHELLPKLAAIGGLGLEYDPEYGGQGADHSFTVVLAEELGRADCAGVPMGIAVQAAMAHPGPALIEFMVRPDESVFPMVVPGTSLAEVIVNEAHAGRNDGKPAGGVQSRPEPVPVPGLRG